MIKRLIFVIFFLVSALGVIFIILPSIMAWVFIGQNLYEKYIEYVVKVDNIILK